MYRFAYILKKAYTGFWVIIRNLMYSHHQGWGLGEKNFPKACKYEQAEIWYCASMWIFNANQFTLKP